MIHFIGNAPAFSDDEIKLSTIEEAVEVLSSKEVIGLDTETTGLNYWNSHMVMLIMGDEFDQFVVDTRYVPIEPLREIIESNAICKILHNSVFDYKFLKDEGIHLEYIHDTQRTEYVIEGSLADPFVSLASLVGKYLGETMEKSVRQSFIGMGGEEFTPSQIIYGARDVAKLPFIRTEQLKKAHKRKLDYVVRLENASYLAVGEMEYHGVRLDKSAWRSLAEAAAKEVNKTVDKLNKIVETDDTFKNCRLPVLQTDLFIDDADLPRVKINWGSPKQVLKVMRNVEPKLEGVAEEVLTPIKHKHKIIETYLEGQEYRKKTTTYGVDFFKHISEDGKVHTNFKTVETGRFSSDKPNLQNIPADNAYRNCFLPPEDGLVFVSADYSSQELALIAHDSQDPVWLKCLEKGEDLHSVCAELVFGEVWAGAQEPDCAYYETYEVREGPDENGKYLELLFDKRQKCNCKEHKYLRQNVKYINFGLAYGMTEHKLSERTGIDTVQAKKLIEKYFRTFPMIKASLEKSALFAKVNGYIRTMPPFGRIRDFEKWEGGATPPKDMAHIERQGKNTHIQGSGADMVKEALIRVRRRIIDGNLPVKIVLTVHDQIDTVTTKEFAEEWKKELVAIMEKCALSIIPSGLLKAEASISPVWQK